MLVECIFFFEAVSQPSAANAPAILSRRQLLLWDYSKTFRPLSQPRAFPHRFSYGSENAFWRLCCNGWWRPRCKIRWDSCSVRFIKERDKQGGRDTSAQVHADMVWRKPWLHLLAFSSARPVTSAQRQKGKKWPKPCPRLSLFLTSLSPHSCFPGVQRSPGKMPSTKTKPFCRNTYGCKTEFTSIIP